MSTTTNINTPENPNPLNPKIKYGLMILGAFSVALAAMNVGNQVWMQNTDVQVVQPTLQQCNDHTLFGLRSVGVDSRYAAGMILKHPEKLKEVCAAVHKDNADITAVRKVHNDRHKWSQNSEVKALAESLDMPREEAVSVVRSTYEQKVKDGSREQLYPEVSIDIPLPAQFDISQ